MIDGISGVGSGAASGCDTMSGRRKSDVRPKIQELEGIGPLMAHFWKKGQRTVRFTCTDCQIAVSHNYAEVAVLTDDKPAQHLLFIVSDDPDVLGNMQLAKGQSAAFDGFILRNTDGTVIEQISVDDPQSIN